MKLTLEMLKKAGASPHALAIYKNAGCPDTVETCIDICINAGLVDYADFLRRVFLDNRQQ